MTNYRSRRIRAILIPSDEREQIGEVTEQSIAEWLKAANIKYMATVNASSELNLVMMIDDDGLDRGLPYNPRAHFLSSYPTEHPIVGNAFMVSMDWTDDGKDIVSIKDDSAAWIKDPVRAAEYSQWLSLNQKAVNYYMSRFPQNN